jgi:hypothetical protein
VDSDLTGHRGLQLGLPVMMARANPVVCPACGKSDEVVKVSTLYVAGIEKKRSSQNEPENNRPEAARAYALSSPELSRRLKPPAAGKRSMSRPLHPDLMVVVFSLVAPIFLYGIYDTQRQMVIPIIGVLVVIYALYFWKRKDLAARFEREKASQQTADDRIKRGIERWMRLYYCAHDDEVFLPGAPEATPTDQMMGLLLQK